MDRHLEKPSLVSYAYNNLRRGIEEGLWREWLPGERKLCSQYRISRPTLRQALQQLDREGIIEIQHGRRTRIVKTFQRHDRRAEKSVVFVSPGALPNLDPFAILTIDLLRKFLVDAAIRFEVRPSSSLQQASPGRRLEQLVRECRADCWILYRAPRAVQEWFRDHDIPSVVMGSTHSGVRFDSVDVDYRAACRHATGMLLARGHDSQRIHLLIPREKLAGHVASTTGFLEALEKKSSIQRARAETPQDPRVVLLDEPAARIAGTMDRLIRKKTAPTALIIQRPLHAVSVMSQIAHGHGLRVPDDLSLVCLDNSPSLEYMIPTITRYAKQPETFSETLFNLTMRLLEPGKPDRRQVLVMPEHIRGASVAPPRPSS